MFVQVIIPLALPTTYTWKVPEHLQATIQIGLRVEVSLRNKKYAGIVKLITTESPNTFTPKDILNILDKEPLVYERQLELWNWIANYYVCTEGEVMQAAIPANLKLNSESILIFNEEFGLDFTELDDDEFVVAQALEIKKELRLSEVQQILDSNHVYPTIKKLIDKQVCLIWEELKEKYKPKVDTFIQLHANFKSDEQLNIAFEKYTNAPKQLELLLAYLHLQKTEGIVTQSNLLKKANASAAQLKGLIDKGILVAQKQAIDRIKTIANSAPIQIQLSELQQKIFEEMVAVFLQKNVCLLHGITASGKTEIYIQLIESYIQKGFQALYMLPEIALTAQMIRRLQNYFGNAIAIYHSKFNPNERVEIWNKVKDGTIKIVLGARSSLFLPFLNLGLIVVDEEHDASYKQQEPAPRYHARDTAIFYANLWKAKVLLGSATPSIESYYNALEKKYGLVQLLQRYVDAPLPPIYTIDTKQFYTKEKGKSILTPPLINAINHSLNNKKQVILFQNRRGYSPYTICENCGWIPSCKHCDVTLTFHKAKNKLSCHYCGTTYPVINTCAACGSNKFTQKNFGTEQIEELVAEHFPNAKVSRMDYDTIKGKNDHDNLIKQFEQQRIDILVGTQMVVKGLDFEHVNLVGIVDGDGILNFTDFRVNERAFQLMEQVSGRAGRKTGDGNVILQVSNTNHPVLQYLLQHDYMGLYKHELNSRQFYGYPPFTRIIQVTCKHKENNIAEEAAHLLIQGIQAQFSNYITGPAQPPVDRVRNQYLWEFLLKLPKTNTQIVQCKLQLQQQIAILANNKRYRSVQVIVDVDSI
jgi:primosomal protein N' (replication factor Y) (superfamily II helicase)